MNDITPTTHGLAENERRQRRRPIWENTVEVPNARRGYFDRPRIIANIDGNTQIVESLDGLSLDTMTPVRAILSRRMVRNAPQRPWLHNQQEHVLVESGNEATIAHLGSREPGMKRIHSQPFWIERPAVGTSSYAGTPAVRSGWAAPDMLWEYDDGRLRVIEAKSRDWHPDTRDLARLVSVAVACQSAGLEYQVRTGLTPIEQGLYDLLHIYRRDTSRAGCDGLLDELLSAIDGPVQLRDVWERFPDRRTKPLLWWAMWHNLVCIDWHVPVDQYSLVRRHGDRCTDATGDTPLNFKCGPHQEDKLPVWVREAAEAADI